MMTRQSAPDNQAARTKLFCSIARSVCSSVLSLNEALSKVTLTPSPFSPLESWGEVLPVSTSSKMLLAVVWRESA